MGSIRRHRRPEPLAVVQVNARAERLEQTNVVVPVGVELKDSHQLRIRPQTPRRQVANPTTQMSDALEASEPQTAPMVLGEKAARSESEMNPLPKDRLVARERDDIADILRVRLVNRPQVVVASERQHEQMLAL